MGVTELKITGIGFTPQSIRGAQQQLFPVQGACPRRTVSGDLISLTSPFHQKYRTLISCEDTLTPSVDRLWPGQRVNVSCIIRLWQSFEAKEVPLLLGRKPVSGSLVAFDKNESPVSILNQRGLEVSLDHEGREGFVSYRPELEMRVVTFFTNTKEWEMKSYWELLLEEV